MVSPAFEIKNFGWHCPTSEELYTDGLATGSRNAQRQLAKTRLRIFSYIPLMGFCAACIILCDKDGSSEATKGLSPLGKVVHYFRWGVSLLSAGIVWLPFDLLATVIRVVASAVFSCYVRRQEQKAQSAEKLALD